MNRKKQLKKLHVLIAARDMAEDILESLAANLTDHSSDNDYMVFGRHQLALLATEAKIKHLRFKLNLSQHRFKTFPLK